MDDELMGKAMLFTQRVPKQGFFEELLRLESKNFIDEFKKTINLLNEEYHKIHKKLNSSNDETNARRYINWSNVLLRYGQFDVLKTSQLKNYSGPFEAEIELIYVQSDIEWRLSNGSPLNLCRLIFLNEQFLNDGNTSHFAKLKLLYYLNVNYHRHNNQLDGNYNVSNYTDQFLNAIGTQSPVNLDEKLYTSIAYRGLAMAKEFGQNKRDTMLREALRLAREISQENIVAKENLYTCLQTLSKWSYLNNDFPSSQRYLEEMILLDPYDTTAYCELSMLYFKRDDFENAAVHYQKAVELGPPGTAMNSYYCAKSFELMGKAGKAHEYYNKCIEFDDQALSPYMELIMYYLKDNKADEAIKLAKHIKQTPLLFEQLEEHEIYNIEKIIN